MGLIQYSPAARMGDLGSHFFPTDLELWICKLWLIDQGKQPAGHQFRGFHVSSPIAWLRAHFDLPRLVKFFCPCATRTLEGPLWHLLCVLQAAKPFMAVQRGAEAAISTGQVRLAVTVQLRLMHFNSQRPLSKVMWCKGSLSRPSDADRKPVTTHPRLWPEHPRPVTTRAQRARRTHPWGQAAAGRNH